MPRAPTEPTGNARAPVNASHKARATAVARMRDPDAKDLSAAQNVYALSTAPAVMWPGMGTVWLSPVPSVRKNVDARQTAVPLIRRVAAQRPSAKTVCAMWKPIAVRWAGMKAVSPSPMEAVKRTANVHTWISETRTPASEAVPHR